MAGAVIQTLLENDDGARTSRSRTRKRSSDEEDGKPPGSTASKIKARFSSALPSGHENEFAYVARGRVHVSDIDGHEYKSLVSYKGYVGSAHNVLRGYSLTGLSRYSVNRISSKEPCHGVDVDATTSPDLHGKNKCQTTRDIFFDRESRSIR